MDILPKLKILPSAPEDHEDRHYEMSEVGPSLLFDPVVASPDEYLTCRWNADYTTASMSNLALPPSPTTLLRA